jgi:hypothetical protein
MGKNLYVELIDKHQEEFNNFPCFFAFDKKQFNEGMEKLGLNPDDTDKIYRGIGGMFYKKSDSQKLKDMLNKHDKEFKEAVANDKTGEGFIYQMFKYELANHEYGYTYELDDTLNALDLTIEEINNNKNLLNGLNKAIECFKY